MTGYKVIFFLFSCLFAQALYCQQTSVPGNRITYDVPAFINEKMYAHTDKNVYVAGEVFWFKLYNVNAVTHRLSDLSKIAYVELIDSLHRPVVQEKINLRNGMGKGSFIISPSVSSGSYKLRVYTSWMKNGSPEDFFEKDITLINVQKLTVNEKEKAGDVNSLSGVPGDASFADNTQRSSDMLSLLITSEKANYNTREKVTLSVTDANLKENFDSAFLSLSVYRIDSLQATDKDRIEAHLSSAVKQNDSKQNTNGKAVSVFAPEYNGHIITGKVLDRNGQPQKGVTAYLSVPGRGTQFYTGISDAGGNVRWETKDFYGSSHLIIQTKEDSSYSIRIDTPFSRFFSTSSFLRFALPYSCPNTLSEHSISMQVSHIYSETKLEQYDVPLYDTLPFYATADKTYQLDDFTRFNTMEEVMREYVALANVTKRRGEFHLPVFNNVTQKMFVDDPLVLLDGVPYFNFNRFMLLDPLKIQKLEVVFRRFFYGSAMFDGVLNWQSYNGDYAETSLEPATMVVDYDGLALQREFYSPSYETVEQYESHLPDFRNVLYWNPDIILKDKQQLSFYTSDLPGTYVAVVQGITQSGKAGSQMIRFEVR